MIYLMNLYVKGHTWGRECILAFFISKVITSFVWAKLEKRGEERRGVLMACSSMRTTKMHECCHKGVVPSPLTSILHMWCGVKTSNWFFTSSYCPYKSIIRLSSLICTSILRFGFSTSIRGWICLNIYL